MCGEVCVVGGEVCVVGVCGEVCVVDVWRGSSMGSAVRL